MLGIIGRTTSRESFSRDSPPDVPTLGRRSISDPLSLPLETIQDAVKNQWGVAAEILWHTVGPLYPCEHQV